MICPNVYGFVMVWFRDEVDILLSMLIDLAAVVRRVHLHRHVPVQARTCRRKEEHDVEQAAEDAEIWK